MFVYLIVNDVNWKIYVGKTKNSNLRQYLQQKYHEAEHYISRRSHLFASIRKYGREHFRIYPLFQGQTNEEICDHEKLLIKALAAQNSEIGYNICRGGEGFTGPHSLAARQKMKKRAAYWTGKKRPAETFVKIIATRRKRYGTGIPPEWNSSPEIIAKRVATRRAKGNYGIHRLGIKHSLETKEKMRVKQLARYGIEWPSQEKLSGMVTSSSINATARALGVSSTSVSRHLKRLSTPNTGS
jgi:group I intron endonuclease